MTSNILREYLAQAMMKGDYWAGVFSQMDFRADNECETIAIETDHQGKLTFLYDKDFLKVVEKTNDIKILEILIEHEGMHILNRHIERTIALMGLPGFSESAAQIASDLAINPLIQNLQKLNSKLGITPELPSLYGYENGLMFEEYYEKLNQQSSNGVNNDQGEENDKTEGQDNLKQNGESNKGDSSEESKGCGGTQSDSPEKSGEMGVSGSPSLGDPVTSHEGWVKDIEEHDPTAVAYQIELNCRNLIEKATDDYVKTWGSVPGNLEHLLNDYLSNPKLPYYQIIKRFVLGSRFGKTKISYSKINRKRVFAFVMGDEELAARIIPFPGKTRDKSFNIGVLVDTSASIPITDDGIYQALSGVQQILNEDKHSFITLLQVDTEIRDEMKIKNVKDIKRFTYKGGGGTRLISGLQRIKQLKCDVAIVFTDGEFRSIHEHSRILPKRLLWVIPEGRKTDSIINTGLIVTLPITGD